MQLSMRPGSVEIVSRQMGLPVEFVKIWFGFFDGLYNVTTPTADSTGLSIRIQWHSSAMERANQLSMKKTDFIRICSVFRVGIFIFIS